MFRLTAAYFVCLCVLAAPAWAQELQPHSSIYRVDLAPGGDASGIADPSGLIGFEWSASCEAFTTSQSFFTRFTTTEGLTTNSDVVLTATEAVDGSSFEFDLADSVNGQVIDHVVGRAEAGQLQYSMPGGRHELPTGTIFPTQHSSRLISSAIAGQSFLEVRVFDGGAEDEIYDTVARIDEATNFYLPHPQSVGAVQLASLQSWIISMSYYDMDDPFGEPTYEITYRMFSNGVVDGLHMDYGAYAFNARLMQLDYLDQPSC